MAATQVRSEQLKDSDITDVDIAIANKDGAVGVPCLRTLGVGATQAAPGNDIRFSKVTTKLLSADLTNNTVTLAKVTGLDLACGIGTYKFEYLIRYQAAAITTGIRFSVNHTGTTSSFVANVRWVDANALASTAAPTQAGVAATGHIVAGVSARLKSTTGWGTTLSVDTTNADMLMIIDGLISVTVAGNLELWSASEVAAATTVKQNSALILTSI